MKNLKLFAVSLSLLLTALATTAKERPQELNDGNEAFHSELKCDHQSVLNWDDEKCILENTISQMDIAILNDYDVFNEEEDATFDFNTKNYLPVDFNQYDEDAFNLAALDMLIEEDTAFDFDTKDYLPVGFNAYDEDAFNLAAMEMLIEEDEVFDFDTNNYLPVGFNAYDEDKFNLAALEKLNEEEDEIFDFNTSDYLPNSLVSSK